VEEMLISAVLPIMTLYRLPHGQYGYSGHVINLPQDVASFANSLPRLPSDLDVIVVRKEGNAQSHHDFRVRRSRVLSALHWLQVNNIYYRNVSINSDAVHLLPEDGDISGLTSVTLEPTNDDISEQVDEDPYGAHLARTFIPISGCQRTQQETIRQSVLEQQSDQVPSVPPTVPWPVAGTNPVNEFTTEGYISCAFPTLFPTGAADLLAPRTRTVTIGNYFKHLMMFQDGRFCQASQISILCTEYRDAMACIANRSYLCTIKMHSFQWKSFVTWLAVMEKPFPTECFTMLPVCVEQGNIGLDSAVALLPWWTHLVYPPSSSLTVLLTFSGQS
jgi:hypothetical protein